MQQKLEITLRQWQEAHRSAPRTPDESVKPDATERMARLAKAESALADAVSSVGDTEVSECVRVWLGTRPVQGADSACNICWLSIRNDREHAECIEKIDRYFEAIKAMHTL